MQSDYMYHSLTGLLGPRYRLPLLLLVGRTVESPVEVLVHQPGGLAVEVGQQQAVGGEVLRAALLLLANTLLIRSGGIRGRGGLIVILGRSVPLRRFDGRRCRGRSPFPRRRRPGGGGRGGGSGGAVVVLFGLIVILNVGLERLLVGVIIVLLLLLQVELLLLRLLVLLGVDGQLAAVVILKAMELRCGCLYM